MGWLTREGSAVKWAGRQGLVAVLVVVMVDDRLVIIDRVEETWLCSIDLDWFGGNITRITVWWWAILMRDGRIQKNPDTQ